MSGGTPAYPGVENAGLGIEVTTRCNGACGHCFVRAGRDAAHDMPIDTALAIAEEGRGIGYRHLHITGGEPLLWPALYRLLDRAAELGYESVFLNTNGALLDAEAARALAAHAGFLTFSVSLQGPEEIHDSVRGAGSFRAARAGLERALDAGLAAYVFTVAGKRLVPVFPRFAEFIFTAYPSVAELTLIQLIRVAGDAFDLRDEVLSPDDFVALVRAAALLNLYGFRVGVLRNPLAAAVSRALSFPWIAREPHLHREGGLTVMADGAITLAHSTREALGAFGPGALARALASPAYRAAVATDDAFCGRCPHLRLCRENGMLRPSEPCRDYVEEAPFCVRAMDAAARNASSP